MSSLQLRFRSDPASFWRFVSSRRRCNALLNEIVLDSQTTSTPVELCDLFSAHFSQIFEPPVSDPDLLEGALLYTPANLINLSDILVSSETVVQVLSLGVFLLFGNPVGFFQCTKRDAVALFQTIVG